MTDRRGFALLAALWLLVALSTASLALALSARTRRLAAANYAEGIRLRAAAQAGIELGRSLLEQRLRIDERLDPWAGVDSVVDTLLLGDARVTITFHDLGTTLNLNRAGEDELRRLFVALPIDASEADRLAQRIADWRDEDDLHRPRGAERDDYLAAEAPALPRNGPFQRVADLRNVLGMTDQLLGRVTPYLTLRSSGQVNLNVASRPVLLTVPGLGEDAVAVLLRYRRAARVLTNLDDLQRDLPAGARESFAAQLPQIMARATTESREVEVTSAARSPGSPVRARLIGVFVRSRDAVFHVWSAAE